MFFNGNSFYEISSMRIETKNTHGTGCTFASAVAAGLAKGCSLLNAIRKAKIYIDMAIKKAVHLRIGKGHGPLNYFPINVVIKNKK
jgi:hydroxymethylpyrimidine/phosphomethylpyrimidine kinase